jgi:hypothetical protein
MKNITVTLFLCLSLVSCKWINGEEDANQTDSIKEQIVGNDKDEHGCLASAGYTWSKLNKECVRAFTGMQLLPSDSKDNEDETLCAYVLFNESKDSAEIFLPNQEESIVLKSATKGKPWMNETWQLIELNGFQLKKDGQVLFIGDGQIGNKVSGSDDSEESAPVAPGE